MEPFPLSLPRIFSPAVPRGVLVFQRARSRDGSGGARDERLHTDTGPLTALRSLCLRSKPWLQICAISCPHTPLHYNHQRYTGGRTVQKANTTFHCHLFLRYFKLRFQEVYGSCRCIIPLKRQHLVQQGRKPKLTESQEFRLMSVKPSVEQVCNVKENSPSSRTSW